MADNQGCYGIEINGECHKTLTQDEAQSILDETAVADNADYATNTERVCNLSKAELMKQSISLYDQGITASDCAGNPVEFAGTGCDGQMTVAYVEDEKLGVRGIYVCGGK